MSRHSYLSLLTAASLFGTAATFAADPANEIVVTATRTAQSVDESLAAVTVLTREDIDASPASDLRELLLGQPGIDATANGGYGKATSLFIRGTESDHVLTLVDGVKLFSATVGITAFQFIPLDQIERIEIVRGPRSSLWGSEAIGGVIHIFTRKGTRDAHYNVSVGLGSDSAVDASAGVSGTIGDVRASIQGATFDTRGIDVTESAQPDTDGYDNQSLTLNLGRDFASGGSIVVGLLRAEGTTEFDNIFDAPSDRHDDEFVQQTSHVRLQLIPADTWIATFQVAQSRDESETSLNGMRSAVFDTRRNSLSWQNDLQVADSHLLTAGIDYADDRVSGSVQFDQASRDNVGLFAQWQGDFDAHRILIGVRGDDNEQFGTETTGNIDYGVSVRDGFRILASYGTGFKAPSFNDLFFPGFGNPTLDPESSRSMEIGLEKDIGGGRWSIRAFHTEIDGLISFDSATFRPFNVGEAEIDGLEIEANKTVGDWDVDVSVSVLDPQDTRTGNTLPRRAKHGVSLQVGRALGRWRLTGSLIRQGRRFDDVANSLELPSFELLGTKVSYDLGNNLIVEATVENLTDKNYQTAAGFNEKGRTGVVRIRYRR